MKKQIVIAALLVTLALPARAIFELGVIGGRIDGPAEYHIGFSAGAGFFLPFLKLEVEYIRLLDTGFSDVSLGLKFRSKVGSVAPYGVAVVGARMKPLGLDLGEYDWFVAIGAGIHLYLKGFLSLRGDIRYAPWEGGGRLRFGLGLFFHI